MDEDFSIGHFDCVSNRRNFCVVFGTSILTNARETIGKVECRQEKALLTKPERSVLLGRQVKARIRGIRGRQLRRPLSTATLLANPR
jgi:hypothetical protein